MIVALIPGYDEAPRIGPVVEAAVRHLPVIVVDDGSSDGTAEVARTAGATVVEQRPNRGKGAALRTGFRRALDDGAEAILTLDADGQHDPDEIPAFLAAWDAPGRQADLVIGRRNFRAMPLSLRTPRPVLKRRWTLIRRVRDLCRSRSGPPGLRTNCS